ncbi:unnamed protein product [Cuscuta epithymum]|uniref:Integrase catalytic domain-containing protein n=1 Tax=Cuscuta epithymum TaxID=186058 RepID=A0AAV0GE23_9ASTE|nr:unnamed protein product [Cuscuta epithymum]
MTGDDTVLTKTCKMNPISVQLPNGEVTRATHVGDVQISSRLKLEKVLLVPGLQCNLISLAQLIDQRKCDIFFTNDICVIQDLLTSIPIGVGDRRGGVYFFRSLDQPQAHAVVVPDSGELWHSRLGHPSVKVLRLVNILNKASLKSVQNDTCDACLRGKQTRDVFNISLARAVEPFELIHCDVWGPYRTPATGGSRYFLTIVDDYSRAVWVHLMREKSEVKNILKQFFAMTSRQFNKPVKVFRSDNGKEFIGLQEYFLTHGIIFQTSCVYTPQQNGRAERKHRHILEVARTLRFHANLPIEFWGECVLAAGYLINRLPSPVIENKSPYEMLYKKPPLYTHLRVFGCLCYAHSKETTGDKFAQRGIKCVFLGYAYTQKGWKVYDLEKQRHFISRDVKFIETIFPFKMVENNTGSTINYDREAKSGEKVQELDHYVHTLDDPPSYPATCEDIILTPSQASGDTLHMHTDNHASPSSQLDTHDTGPIDSISTPSPGDNPSRRGTRQRKPPTWHRDYDVQLNTVKINSSPVVNSHPSVESAISAAKEPSTFSEASRDPQWREAMSREIAALERSGTWRIQDLPSGKKAIFCKWVYKIKYKSDGSVERYKARLVVCGNRQVQGIDYSETFAPVAKMVTVRTILAVAASRHWELHQMDVDNAFLHGDLHEEVYMHLPPGYSASSPGKSHADYSLFTLRRDDRILCVLIYVDDLLITGNDHDMIVAFKSFLAASFPVKDLGKMKYFLGIEVARNSTGIFLCQRKYVLDILAETGLTGARPVSFPMVQNHKLQSDTGPNFSDPDRYRRLVGKLIYLTLTRPDICYSVHILSQFMQCPKVAHWEAVLRVLRYLKSHPGQGILLRSDSPLTLTGFCDADWASCPVTRRSVTGYFVSLGQSPISWRTKKQATISRSSAEAEYRSMAALTCELIWLRNLLRCLGVVHPSPVQLYCDNQAALHIASNPVYHERTKHIELDCHFIRDHIQAGTISPSYTSTSEQPADMLTKALGASQFSYLLAKMGICDPHAPS